MIKSTAIQTLEILQSKSPFALENYNQIHDLDGFVRQMVESLGINIDVETILKEFANYTIEAPTKYQNPHTYSLLNSLISSLKSVVDENSADLTEKYKIQFKDFPVFGSVSMGLFSAQVLCLNNENLLLFSDGVFGFANLISKIIACCCPINGARSTGYNYSFNKTEIKKNLDNNGIIIARFLDVMFAYMINKDPHQAKQYFIDKKYLSFSEIIRDSFELFIVAHEYAHISLGHFTNEQSKELLDSNNNDFDVNALIYNWNQELDADALGAHLVILLMQKKGYDSLISAFGIWTCLNVIWLIDRLKEAEDIERIHIPSFSTTHPPVDLRKENILQMFSKIKGSNDFFLTIDFIFEELWDRFFSFYQSLKKTFNINEINSTEINFRVIQKIIYKMLG